MPTPRLTPRKLTTLPATLLPVRTGADLHAAIRAGNEELIQRCLDNSQDSGIVNSRVAPDQWTPLMRAATTGKTALVSMLIDMRADPSALSTLGRTALHHAAYANDADIVAILMAASGTNPNVRDVSGLTALHLAKMHGEDTPVVRTLEAKIKQHKEGRRTLGERSKTNITLALKADGDARADALARLKAGDPESAVLVAQDLDAAIMAATSIQRVARGRSRRRALNRIAESALPYAIDDDSDDDDNAEAVALCLAAAGLKKKSSNGAQASAPTASAGRLAAAFGKTKALNLLIDSGADVNAGDERTVHANTPLHWAVLHGRQGAARILLEAKADPTIRNREGRSALDLARESAGMPELIEQMERTPQGRRDVVERAYEQRDVAVRDASVVRWRSNDFVARFEKAQEVAAAATRTSDSEGFADANRDSAPH